MKTNKVILYFLLLLTPLSIFAQKMELIVPTGYKYNVAQFKLTPDGRFFIGVNGNDMVLWEAKTQRQLRTFKDIKSDGKINDFKISPNGKNIVVFMRFEVHCFELETGKKLWTSPKLEYENYSGSFFDNGNKIAVIGGTDGNIISAQTGAVISKVKGFEGHEGKTYTLPDDNILVASYNFYRVFNTKTGVLGEKMPVKLLAVSEKNYMGFALNETNIQVYDLKTNKIIKTIKLTVPDPNLGMTMEGDALLVVSQTADEYANKTSTAKKYSLPQLTETNLKISDMLSKNISGSSTYDIIWSGTGKIRRLSNSALVGNMTGQLMDFDYISGLTYSESFWRKSQIVGFKTEDKLFRYFDLKSGQIKGNINFTKDDYIPLSAISSDGKRWIGYFDADKSLRYYDMETGKLIKTFPTDIVPDFYRDIFQLSVSDTHELLYWADKYKNAHEFDLKTGKTSDKTDFYVKPNPADIFKNNNLLNLLNEKGNVYLYMGANQINIYLAESKKLIGTYYSFKGTKDWVVVTPDGRYDGTPEAFKRMYYVRNTEVVSLDALFEKFYTPGLYQMLINGTPPPVIQENVDDLKAAPIVKIGVPVQQRNLVVEDDKPRVRRYQMTGDKINLTIDATCEIGVTEIRLYHNGKLYGSGTRNLTVDDDTPEKKKAQTFDIQLVEGENLFKAIAVNTQKTESQPDEILVTYKAAKASKPQNTEGVSLCIW